MKLSMTPAAIREWEGQPLPTQCLPEDQLHPLPQPLAHPLLQLGPECIKPLLEFLPPGAPPTKPKKDADVGVAVSSDNAQFAGCWLV